MLEFKAGVLVANSQQISWNLSAVLNDNPPPPQLLKVVSA